MARIIHTGRNLSRVLRPLVGRVSVVFASGSADEPPLEEPDLFTYFYTLNAVLADGPHSPAAMIIIE
jgi:hypothetical protein